MNRPYFNYSVQQLEEEVEKLKPDVPKVRTLRAELEQRTKPRALRLRDKIDAYLKFVTAAAQVPATPVVAKSAEPCVPGGSMKFFGIDLGTSKCCVAYAVNSARPNVIPQPEVVDFCVDRLMGTNSPAVPSLVAWQRPAAPSQGATLFAFEAEAKVCNGQLRERDGHGVFRSVKSHLGTGRSYVRADTTLNTPVKVWASLIRRLCDMTVERKGIEFDPRRNPTVLTVPASFGKAQREETLEAARLAGFEVSREADLVHLIDEPVAALIDTLNHADIDLHVKPDGWNTVLVFDFGGGTCDLTLLKFRYDASKPTGIEDRPLAISPYEQLGGDTIDSIIMDKVVWPQVCRENKITREQLSASDRRWIADQTTYGVCRKLKVAVNKLLEPLTADRLEAHDWDGIKVDDLPLGGILYSRGKELHGYAELSANDLYEIMLPFLEPDPAAERIAVGEGTSCFPFARLIDITMKLAGLSPGKLDLLVLHGGSCQSPLIRPGFERMQRSGFLSSNCRILQTPNLVTSVARGAALFGCLSQKYGKPYIRPIVPEDMSVETVGHDFEPLVHAGDELPCKKSFPRFYLSSAGQQQIVLPIHIGHGSESRRHASTLTIPVAQTNLPQSHPIEVELEIGVDKISRWRFRPKGYEWSDAFDVANPWIGSEPSEEVTKLLECRKKIRALIDAEERPSASTLSEEALQTARAGFTEEALTLIEDLRDEFPTNAIVWNVKAMIHAQRREYQDSLKSYEVAVALEPDNLVLRGNYGTCLVRLGRYKEAVAVMRDALSRDASLTYLHSWLADAFQAIPDTEEMNRELEMCYAHASRKAIQQPEDVSAWEDLRTVAMRVGRYKEAEQARETIRRLRRPNNLLSGSRHS